MLIDVGLSGAGHGASHKKKDFTATANYRGGVQGCQQMAGAELFLRPILRRPACPGHVVDAYDPAHESIRNEDLSSRGHSNTCWVNELVDPAAVGAEGSPARPGHIVDPNDADV